MDLFVTKNEKIEKLEKMMREIGKRTDRKMENMEHSFETFRKVVFQMQKENAELKRDRDFLLERYKEIIRKIPVTNVINENARLIRDIVMEDLNMEKDKHIDDLFELVMKKRMLTTKVAARRLGIREETVRKWATRLQEQQLINVSRNWEMTKRT